jgi:hypothetical protein
VDLAQRHTVLRNRVYLGEIYYRGNWYPAPHEPLIDTELLDRAQTLLSERGEDRSQRRSNPTEYLLSGRLHCGRCGKPYIGTASHGRNGRYTYYTCFTTMRHGTSHCSNDRLPAGQLEIVKGHTYHRSSLRQGSCRPRRNLQTSARTHRSRQPGVSALSDFPAR